MGCTREQRVTHPRATRREEEANIFSSQGWLCMSDGPTFTRNFEKRIFFSKSKLTRKKKGNSVIYISTSAVN
jgi:hypothetical protein